MGELTYQKPERLSLKEHPDFDEKWVQDRIAEDPTILGLGDVVMKDRERGQPRGGRLDLLLQDVETSHRYEVELQLGSTDETHIIRTIEYWDVEKKRYPQYEHSAVLIAEDITSRFLSIIELFNGALPLVAIQLNAVRIGDTISLVFTTVLDERTLGLVDEDEDVAEVTDRAYWEGRATKETVQLADKLLETIRTFEPKASLKYNKFYIGLTVGNRANNFVDFIPQKAAIRLELKMPRSDEIDQLIKDSGIDTLGYDRHWGTYRLRLVPPDLEKHGVLLADLMKRARYKGSLNLD
jgi:predicted transport protein